MKRFSAVWAGVICCLVMAACMSQPAAPQGAGGMGGKATVVWISIDGNRGDYFERVHPPFLSRLAHEGAYTEHLQTIFPTLTFPSHVAEVTGARVSAHGIPANDFYDTSTKTKWNFPPDGALLLAEPIWTTAARQHIRTAVYDWPLSQMQKGPNADAYFNPDKFDSKLTDEQRLDKLADVYEADTGTPPLRLLMGYIEATDKVGHKTGPNAPEIDAELLRADDLLHHIFDRMQAAFEKRKTSPNDVLYFLVTTDHGMSQVTTLVRLDFVLDLPQHGDVVTMTSGPIGNIYLPAGLSAGEKERRLAGLMEKLNAKTYLKAYRQKDLPAKWYYRNDTRIGDIVVVLKKGYTFSSRIPLAEYPVEKEGNPKGMHGYPLEWDSEMEGFMAAWRSAAPWHGRDLGAVDVTRLHATVARWLGIEPAPGAERRTIGL